MQDYILSCSSTADLSREYYEKLGIKVVYFHFSVDGVDYRDDMGETVPPEILFGRMLAGALTGTSRITAEEYMGFFEPFLSEGKDILHVTLSSGISDTCLSARAAQSELAKKYPERKIYIVDSLAASSGYGLLMATLAEKRAGGMDIASLRDWAEEHKLELQHWFFSTDLTFYIRGGRISRAAGFFGQMLNICPLFNMDDLGRLTLQEKVRTKRKVLRRVVEMMVKHAAGSYNYAGRCFICHSLCPEDAKATAELIETAFPRLTGPVEIFPIGDAIGSHTGPGTISVFFWGDRREE